VHRRLLAPLLELALARAGVGARRELVEALALLLALELAGLRRLLAAGVRVVFQELYASSVGAFLKKRGAHRRGTLDRRGSECRGLASGQHSFCRGARGRIRRRQKPLGC
jgi:hypothetical protein